MVPKFEKTQPGVRTKRRRAVVLIGLAVGAEGSARSSGALRKKAFSPVAAQNPPGRRRFGPFCVFLLPRNMVQSVRCGKTTENNTKARWGCFPSAACRIPGFLSMLFKACGRRMVSQIGPDQPAGCSPRVGTASKSVSRSGMKGKPPFLPATTFCGRRVFCRPTRLCGKKSIK